MNAEDYLPDADTVAAIEKDIANYNNRRQAAREEVARRIPLYVGSYVAVAVALLGFIYVRFWPQEFAALALGMGLPGSVVGAAVVYAYAQKVGVDTQQDFRYHMLPVLFGFIGGVRYTKGVMPHSFERMPDAVKGSFNTKRVDDVITGRLGGKGFEVYELVLAQSSKNSETIRFKGLVLTCVTAQPINGTLVATSFARDMFRPIRELFSREKLVSFASNTPLDRLYEFRADDPEEARKLVAGRLGEVLAWINKSWPGDAARLAVRRSELFVMLPSSKDFFELPPLDQRLDYKRHLAPMMKDFAALMAIVAEIHRKPESKAKADIPKEETSPAPPASPVEAPAPERPDRIRLLGGDPLPESDA